MKRFLTCLSLGLVLAFTAQAQGPKLHNVGVADSCGGGTLGTTVRTYVTMSGGTPGTCIVELNHGDGSKLDTLSFMGSGPSYVAVSTHTYTTTGTYTMKYVLICSGARVDSVNATAVAGCTYIGGFLYEDANSNCTYNAGEYYVASAATIKVDSAGVAIDTLHTTAYWSYPMHGPTSTVFTFTIIGNPTGYTASCSTSFNATFSGPSAYVHHDFAFSCSATPVYDYALHFSRALRGSSSTGASYIHLYATNLTCHSDTGTVTLHVSPKYSINTSSIMPTPASVSGNTVTWILPNLSHGIWHALYVPLTPLSTTTNGDTACNNAVIAPTADANPANNSISLCDSVRESWDPNEKSVQALQPLAPGSLLRYTIDFENLGNDTAFNIHIQDTLDSYLDANSFALESSTHPVNVYRYQSGSLNILKFDFPNINLEDASVPDRNKGQVQFTMRISSLVSQGAVIANRAGIYFDANPVVLTNYAYIKMPTEAVEGYEALNGVRVMPNPVSDVLRIELSNAGWEHVSLFNTLGQQMYGQSLHQGSNRISLAQWPVGIYYLRLEGRAGSKVIRIQKQ